MISNDDSKVREISRKVTENRKTRDLHFGDKTASVLDMGELEAGKNAQAQKSDEGDGQEED